MNLILNLKEMHIPLRPIPEEDSLRFSINWATNKNWQTNLLDRRKVFQLNILRQESVHSGRHCSGRESPYVPRSSNSLQSGLSLYRHSISLLFGPPQWPRSRASASRAECPEFESRLRRDFSGSSHTSDLKIVSPVATLPGAWRYRVSAGTGRSGVSIL